MQQMKKLVILTLLAFTLLATAKTGNIQSPPPRCNPCPLVR
jgi:hypothetical protein